MKSYQEFLNSQGEKRWQERWEKKKLFQTPKDVTPDNKFYILPQLPYPSGSGLHVGHAEVYSACDIYARYQRMKGKKVLQAIGWDSFGLPAENYAIKTNVHPKVSTEKAIDNFRKQIKSLGISVDWDREVGSHNSDYYKWTQWFFLLMYKRGLAYRKKQAVNWCESCKTVLANDQVKEGKCERCDTVIIQKDMEQWYLKITDYAERLLTGLDKLDWPEETIKRQRDWIGRSEGAEVQFDVVNVENVQDVENEQAKRLNKRSDTTILTLKVFTTRPDTLFGATYMVLAPEGQYVKDLKDKIENWDEVEKYIEVTSKKTDLDRQIEKEKTGVELKGVKAINPVTEEEIPIYIADYVLSSYGTGAIMAVPAHDERDFEFAMKFGVEVREVVVRQIGERKKEGHSRPGVYAVITKDDKIFVMRDNDTGYYRIPGGGIESSLDSDILETLKREIEEETGFKKFKIKDYFATIEACSHSTDNKVYQHRLMRTYNVSLENEEKNQEFEEKDKWEHSWMSYEETKKAFAKNKEEIGEMELIDLSLGKISKCFSEEGVAMNSDFLDGLETVEAKKKMITWLEEKGIGKGKIQYRLRDWSVSRQRFWGAPIPMLQNEEVKNKKYNYVFIHGYGGNKKDVFLPWLKEELEKEGHSVWCETLPNTDKPNVQSQAEFVLENNNFDENTIIVAHSLGGPVTYRILETVKTKIAKVVLVDPVVEPDFPDKKRPDVEKSDNFKFDFKKIKSKCDDFVVLEEKAHTTIFEKDIKKLAENLNAKVVVSEPNQKHFCASQEEIILQESIVTGLKPIPESDLPVILPDDVDFKPTGESPLNYSKSFAKGVEKKYGEGWKREPDTLDTFMCSSWYFFRYLDPKNDKVFASPEQLKKWMPIDFYLGGPEHVNGHLLYSRFFTKVLFDAGYIDFDEPFTVNRHQGLILGKDGRKMSKRWDNAIDPTDVVNEYGADTVRMYEMFMGPLEDDKPWNMNGVKGVRRFLDKVWALQNHLTTQPPNHLTTEIDKATHKTIKKVSKDMETLGFNTAIARMMELVNLFNKEEKISTTNYELLIAMLSPFAPHMAEELWSQLGNKDSVCIQDWPEYDENLVKDDEITLAIQVNGKVRGDMVVPVDISEDEVKKQALEIENVAKWLDGKEPKKVIYVKGKLVSVVV